MVSWINGIIALQNSLLLFFPHQFQVLLDVLSYCDYPVGGAMTGNTAQDAPPSG